MYSLATILSAFNEKGTLLIWLKKLEKALEGAALAEATATTGADGLTTFSFIFDDGTKVDTPPILIKGETGEQGNGIASIVPISTEYAPDTTITVIEVRYTNGNKETLRIEAKNGANAVVISNIGTPSQGTGIYTGYTVTPLQGSTAEQSFTFNAYAKNGEQGATGADGKEGNGIDTISDFGHTEENGYTVTTLDVVYTDPAHVPPHERIKVFAKNGENGAAGENGNKWYIGQRVDDIPPTNNGDCYLYLFPNPAHAANGYVYQVINNQWVNVGQLIGKQGEAGENGTNGKDGNGIVSVHALRHYENAGETITVIEQVTDEGNMQFEVHAQNGKVYNHFLNFQVSKDNINFQVSIPICLSTSTPIETFDNIKALLAENKVNCVGSGEINGAKYLINEIIISDHYNTFNLLGIDTQFSSINEEIGITGSNIFAVYDNVIEG